MKKGDLEKLRKALEAQLATLQLEVGQELPQAHHTPLADVNDQASFESERNFELRIRDRERKLVAKVQTALKKIGEGTYGICESCAEPIGVKRLLARPVTTFCINCKAELEAEERKEESLPKTEQPTT